MCCSPAFNARASKGPSSHRQSGLFTRVSAPCSGQAQRQESTTDGDQQAESQHARNNKGRSEQTHQIQEHRERLSTRRTHHLPVEPRTIRTGSMAGSGTRPLLVIHLLAIGKEEDDLSRNTPVVAWSISFPWNTASTREGSNMSSTRPGSRSTSATMTPTTTRTTTMPADDPWNRH